MTNIDCENCKALHTGEYGSGRFCNKACARSFSTKKNRKEINEKVSISLTGRILNPDRYKRKCKNCQQEFESQKGTAYCTTRCKEKSISLHHDSLKAPESKLFGPAGEAYVLFDLLKKGYYVYTEFCESSRVDLIALDDKYKVYKIQVKSAKVKNNTVQLNLCSGTGKRNGIDNTKHVYTKSEVDVFALYIRDLEKAFYIPMSDIPEGAKGITLRLSEPKTHIRKSRMLYQYENFPCL